MSRDSYAKFRSKSVSKSRCLIAPLGGGAKVTKTKAIRTDVQARNASADDRDAWLPVEGCPGLYLRVRASGGKVWTYRYSITVQGEAGPKHLTRTLALGKYPALGLAQARTDYLAAALQVQKARQGEAEADPVEARREKAASARRKRGADREAVTVADLYREWGGRLTRVPTGSKRTERKDGGEELRRIMERDVLPLIGDMKAKEVTRQDVQDVCNKKREGSAPRTFIQGRILSYLRQLFDWAIEQNIPGISHNPASGVRKASIGVVNAVRDRALSFREIADLRGKLPACGLHESVQAAIALFLATGMRLEELVTARWDFIDEHERTLTLPETKNDRKHTIPLSAFAWRQLEALRKFAAGPYLLNGRKDDAPRDKKQFASSIGERVSATPQKGRSDRYVGTLALSGGHWTMHDLRRTMATRMQELGIAPHVIERCLNHKTRGVMASYQHYEYVREMRAAYDRWGEALDRIWRGESVGAEVIELAVHKAG